MSLFEISAAAHLTGSIVLALFFVLLVRHDPRPYLRRWTAAWLAQVAALVVLLASSLRDWHTPLALYLCLESVHGALILAAAQNYASGRRFGRGHGVLLGALAAWSAAATLALPEVGRLHAAQFGLLAVFYLSAAAVLWPLREPTAMGLRLTSNILGLLGLLFALQATMFWVRRADDVTSIDLAIVPFEVLFLQMLLGLAMVLAVMEAAQWALAATNTQLKEAERRLKTLAETDPLTACFNRRVFRELVDDLRARHEGPEGVVVMLDMDGLKAINDLSGHAAGDEAIRSVAETVRDRTRTTDVLVRWGGDEFVVVIPGASRAEGEGRRAEIVAGVAAAGFSVSAGLAAYDANKDIMEAVKEADSAMYEAKSQRRGRLRL